MRAFLDDSQRNRRALWLGWSVKREVALKLKAIQADLAKRKLSLKMFDCYRPTRATAEMLAWSRDGKDSGRRWIPGRSGCI